MFACAMDKMLKGRSGYSWGTFGNCTLLSSKTSLIKFKLCSLSTFPQVIAAGMAASVDDAPDYLPGQLHSRKDALKALRHTQKDMQ